VKENIFSRHLFGFGAALGCLLSERLKQLSYTSPADRMALIPCHRINNLKCVKSFKEVEKLDIIRTSPLHQGKMYLFDEQEYTVVYCPVDQGFADQPPDRGGPFCTCREYQRNHGICRHILCVYPSYQPVRLGQRIYRGRPRELPIGEGHALKRLPVRRRN